MRKEGSNILQNRANEEEIQANNRDKYKHPIQLLFRCRSTAGAVFLVNKQETHIFFRYNKQKEIQI